MKNQIKSVLAVALLSAFAGCATTSDEPSEGITSSNVTEFTTNYITCTNQLAKRWCSDPGGCDTGIRMPVGTRLEVAEVNWSNKIAHFTSSPYGEGYALADNNGEVYISKNPATPCP
jgi:hypothetical protein